MVSKNIGGFPSAISPINLEEKIEASAQLFIFFLLLYDFSLILQKMAMEIQKQLSECTISDKETANTAVHNSELVIPTSSVAIKFVSRRYFNVLELKKLLLSSWKVNSSLIVTSVGDGLYVVDFNNKAEMQEILDMQPWNLRRSLMVLKPLTGDECFNDMKMDRVPFWVQIHRLPAHAMTKVTGERVGSILGEVIQVNAKEGQVAWGESLRVRVLYDTETPLCRFSNFTANNVSTIIFFRYERLSDFCTYCGLLTHSARACSKVRDREDDWVEGHKFFPEWLKADKTKRPNAGDIHDLSRLIGIDLVSSNNIVQGRDLEARREIAVINVVQDLTSDAQREIVDANVINLEGDKSSESERRRKAKGKAVMLDEGVKEMWQIAEQEVMGPLWNLNEEAQPNQNEREAVYSFQDLMTTRAGDKVMDNVQLAKKVSKNGQILQPLSFSVPYGFHHKIITESLMEKEGDNRKGIRVFHQVGKDFKNLDYVTYEEVVYEGEHPYVPLREEMGQNNVEEEHSEGNNPTFSIPGDMRAGKKRLWRDHSGDLADFIRAEKVRQEMDGLFFLKKARSMLETYGSEISFPMTAEVEVTQPRRDE